MIKGRQNLHLAESTMMDALTACNLHELQPLILGVTPFETSECNLEKGNGSEWLFKKDSLCF